MKCLLLLLLVWALSACAHRPTAPPSYQDAPKEAINHGQKTRSV